MSKTVFCLVLLLPMVGSAANVFVSPKGSDSNAGTKDFPLRTVQAAVDRLRPGDACLIRGGTYREAVTIGVDDVRLLACPDERVVFDGTETFGGKWEHYRGGIYKTRLPHKVEQLFIGRRMMVEARWPNMRFDQAYERDCWASTDRGSTHGKLVSEAVAKSGIDWTGAMACLNVGHQWWTWNRPVIRHGAGSTELEYDADLVGLCNFDPDIAGQSAKWMEDKWSDDYFYLFGTLKALDAETEWFQDPETGTLYLYAPGGADPTTLDVKYKTRNYALYAKGRRHIQVEGIDFFAATFRFDDCDDCLLEDCELLYPTWTRTIEEYNQERKESIITKITGDRNTVRHCSLAYANNSGLLVMGNSNRVENCIIHDVNWFGTLIYPALQLSSSPHLGVNWFNTIQYPPTERTIDNSEVTSYGNVASHNTIYNGGGSLLVYQSADTVVEYNHIHDGGLASKDVSLVYGCWPFARGSTVCFNWVHGCVTDGFFGARNDGGIGIRADDQSRRNTFHHNVVWDCGKKGIIMKGEDHRAFNNTVFGIGGAGVPPIPVLIPKSPEPVKVWAVQWPQLRMQNQWTEVLNNVAWAMATHVTDTNLGGVATICIASGDALEESKTVHHNLTGQDVASLLEAPGKLDFRPRAGSALIDSGVAVPGYTDGVSGAAPDLGAYERGGRYWVPGADWQEEFTDLSH